MPTTGRIFKRYISRQPNVTKVAHRHRWTMKILMKPITGWWLGHPSEKYASQLGWLATQYEWENKIDVPNHQPVIHFNGIFLLNHPAMGYLLWLWKPPQAYSKTCSLSGIMTPTSTTGRWNHRAKHIIGAYINTYRYTSGHVTYRLK